MLSCFYAIYQIYIFKISLECYGWTYKDCVLLNWTLKAEKYCQNYTGKYMSLLKRSYKRLTANNEITL